MDNFDLKKYLAENKLNEGIFDKKDELADLKNNNVKIIFEPNTIKFEINGRTGELGPITSFKNLEKQIMGQINNFRHYKV